MNISRISRALGVSRSTVRRWISSNNPKLSRTELTHLHQRAILRGRGDYLWPDLDPVSRRRADLTYEAALRARDLIGNEPDRVAPEWRENGTLETHQVHLIWFPYAHAYGVASTRHEKSLARVARHGEILQTVTVPDKYSAVALKHEVLRDVDEHRCISPRALVPTGRTETWRAAGGEPDALMPFQAAVVRFAGLPSHAAVTRELEAALTSATREGHTTTRRAQLQTRPVIDHVVTDAEGLWDALSGTAFPASLLVLSSPAETPSTWPEGPWDILRRVRHAGQADQSPRRRQSSPDLFLGARRVAGASSSGGQQRRSSGGTSFLELLEAAQEDGDRDWSTTSRQVPNVVVLDVPHLNALALKRWRQLIHPSTLLLTRIDGPAARGQARNRELSQLALIAQRARTNRGRRRLEHAAISHQLTRYRDARQPG